MSNKIKVPPEIWNAIKKMGARLYERGAEESGELIFDGSFLPFSGNSEKAVQEEMSNILLKL